MSPDPLFDGVGSIVQQLYPQSLYLLRDMQISASFVTDGNDKGGEVQKIFNSRLAHV